MQITKQQKPKDPVGGFVGYLVSIVISVVVIIYLGYHFINSFGTEMTTEYALQITENDMVEFDAYILRNETVVYSTVTGGIGYSYTDGTKVHTGATVASIYSGNADTGSETRSEIITLDREIELLRESNRTDGLSASDTSTLDNRISDYYLTIRKSAEQGVYQNLPKRRDELLTLLNKRLIITGRVKDYNDAIQSLEYERELLTANLDSVSETVTAPVTGFFHSTLDGYENIFTGDLASDMSLQTFDNLMLAKPQEYPPTAIGKIATDFTWSIVLETTRDQLRYYNKGWSYRIAFPYNNDVMLTMRLTDVIAPDAEQRILLVFSCYEIPEDFSFRRMQPVNIVRSSHTGYKVPISAVRLMQDASGNQRMGVFILVGNVVDFRFIEVILESDGYYIVAPQDLDDPEYPTKLALYDIIITGGKDLYVGKIIT